MESLRQEPDIIDVKTAAHKALDYIKSLYEEEPIQNLGLEEVKLSDDDGMWSVTVGFSRPWSRQNVNEGPLAALKRSTDPWAPKSYPIDRDYKQVRIDARSGEVRGMEIRKL